MALDYLSSAVNINLAAVARLDTYPIVGELSDSLSWLINFQLSDGSGQGSANDIVLIEEIISQPQTIDLYANLRNVRGGIVRFKLVKVRGIANLQAESDRYLHVGAGTANPFLDGLTNDQAKRVVAPGSFDIWGDAIGVSGGSNARELRLEPQNGAVHYQLALIGESLP